MILATEPKMQTAWTLLEAAVSPCMLMYNIEPIVLAPVWMASPVALSSEKADQNLLLMKSVHCTANESVLSWMAEHSLLRYQTSLIDSVAKRGFVCEPC